VFWSGRNERTHSQQVKDELAQSYEHLRLAAGHAAGGAAEMMTPPYDRARIVATRGWGTTRDAFAPFYEQVRDGAANARRGNVVVVEEKRKSRWPTLFGLLAAGAAVGAASAIAARRRRAASEWDEYEPLGGIDTGYGMPESKSSATSRKLTESAASVAGSVSSSAGKIADSLHGRSSRPGDPMSTAADQMSDGLTDPSRRNSRP
jgi:hypothetical protein